MISNKKYDFIDLGAKKGGSIEYCKRRFKVENGLGIDTKERMVEAGRRKGYDIILHDALTYEHPDKVTFVSMLDFLEHLPNTDMAKDILKKYSSIAEDFIFIRHPLFDDYDYLKSQGLKFTWHEWSDHTNKMTIQEITYILYVLGLSQYTMLFRLPITDSKDSRVVPIDAPADTLEYDQENHGKKKDIKFPKKLYSQVDIFIALRPFEKLEWNKIVLDKKNFT